MSLEENENIKKPEEPNSLKPPFLVKHGYFLMALSCLPGCLLGTFVAAFSEAVVDRGGSALWLAKVPVMFWVLLGFMTPMALVGFLVGRATSLSVLNILEFHLKRQELEICKVAVRIMAMHIWRRHLRARQQLVQEMNEHPEIFAQVLGRLG